MGWDDAEWHESKQVAMKSEYSLESGSDKNTSRYELSNTDDPLQVIPVISEQATVQKRKSTTGSVAIRKSVHERTEVVDPALQADEVKVERVAVNRIVEAPVPVRQEGDTTIISLLEEVLVVEKRLVVREEVHITRVHKEIHDPQEVQLREEHVEIVRTPHSDPASS